MARAFVSFQRRRAIHYGLALYTLLTTVRQVLTINKLNMKSLKKELIDFYVWCINNDIDHNIDIRIEKAVDKYLSINSEAQNETPNVNNNEAQKKDCNTCEYRWMPINDCCRCDSLNNYEYWKQSD